MYVAHAHIPIEPDTSPTLDDAGIKCVQGITGALLWYILAVNKKILVDISYW